MNRRNLAAFVLLCLISFPSVAETVQIEAGRDATLIEHPDGALANGSGPYFFVGRTNQEQNSVRRGLVWFDVAGELPARAIIEEAALTLYLSPSNQQTSVLRVHRVLADWGEGPSSASGGGGRPAEPGDSTWIHTFYDADFWVHSGGQFVGRSSAKLEVAGPGLYTWDSTNHLVQDVRLWNSAPKRNFGWMLIGDESTPQNSKSFVSRENPEVALRPVLQVTYRLPGRRD